MMIVLTIFTRRHPNPRIYDTSSVILLSSLSVLGKEEHELPTHSLCEAAV